MEPGMMVQNDSLEMDLQRLLNAVGRKIWWVILSTILATAIAFFGTLFLITPKYESSAMFYVNNNSLSVGDLSITSSDITASKSLVESYIVILQTRESLNAVIDYAEVDLTYTELTKMITAESVNSTEIFRVIVTSTNPREAENIADAIAYILPKRISSIIEGTAAKVVDAAVLPAKPSSPSYPLNTVIGFVFGFVMSVSIIIFYEIFDITIRTEDDMTAVAKKPILVAVPDMSAPSRNGNYYYAYDKKKGKKDGKKGGVSAKSPALVGEDISFSATEAYKLLRTKIQFSFSDESTSRVIGVSSALSGEGKSISSINLAYSLSQLDKRVLLIDCDMRRPSISTKLPVSKVPGLSNYLSGQTDLEILFQDCGIPGYEDAFTVIAAGRNPPNPVELLSSSKMSSMLKHLRQSFDYIVLDLPPVGEVTDALAVANETDGMLLVVRQNYCNRHAYKATAQQFDFIGARVLGIVYNCATDNVGTYGTKYYRKYGRKKGGSYAAYGAAAKKAKALQQHEGADK